MDLRAVAELAGMEHVSLRSWVSRGVVRLADGEAPEGAGLPSRIGPKSTGQIIAIAALVRVGFEPRSAANLVYGRVG